MIQCQLVKIYWGLYHQLTMPFMLLRITNAHPDKGIQGRYDTTCLQRYTLRLQCHREDEPHLPLKGCKVGHWTNNSSKAKYFLRFSKLQII